MPAYNEEDNIRRVIDEWYPILKYGNSESKMIIADGGSKDHTLEILRELEQKIDKLEVLDMPGTDHGTKVWALYDYAIKCGADWIFQTDSDGQTDPREFELFWDNKNEYDAVIGNRSKRQDEKDRVFVEKVLLLYLRLFFGARIPDSNAPFRLMKKELVAKYLYKLPENFNLPNAMLCAYFSRYNERVVYKEISFNPRQGGKNYMNPKRIIKIGWQSIGNFMQLRRNLDK